MSTRTSSSSSTSTSRSKSKFCKVCYDAGKTVSIYSSHYVRDSIGGKVVCPLILNQQCKYCKKPGHTPSHCPALEGKYKQSEYKQSEYKQSEYKQSEYKQSEYKHNKNEQAQAEQAQAEQAQAEQAQAEQTPLQKRAALLCESPPPVENKNYFSALFDKAEQEVKTILNAVRLPEHRTSPKSWASIVKKAPVQAKQQAKQQEQAIVEEAIVEEAIVEEAQAQPKQQEQAIVEEAIVEEAQAQAIVEEAQAQAIVEEAYIPDYSKCSWADY